MPLLGNVYVADGDNDRIRKVTVATGIITTIAGSSAQGYSGDNGAATSATLWYPTGVVVDSAGTIIFIFLVAFLLHFQCALGNVYIADYSNHRVRKVTVSTDIITSIAGSGGTSYSGDGGPATAAGLNCPYGVALDASGMQLTNTSYY